MQVMSKCGDSAPSREIVSDERYSRSCCGLGFHSRLSKDRLDYSTPASSFPAGPAAHRNFRFDRELKARPTRRAICVYLPLSRLEAAKGTLHPTRSPLANLPRPD